MYDNKGIMMLVGTDAEFRPDGEIIFYERHGAGAEKKQPVKYEPLAIPKIEASHDEHLVGGTCCPIGMKVKFEPDGEMIFS